MPFGVNTENGFKKINENFYVCPLCLKVFFESALDQKGENPLTIEDLPPKSMGKKLLILTCKKCNNESGYKLDHQIIKHLKVDPFLSGTINSGIEANFNLSGNKYIKGKLNIKGDSNLHFDLPEIENPYLKQSLEKQLKDWNKVPFTINFTVPENRKVKLAYLRIGYLIFFNYFGYLPLFDKNLKIIRDQLLSPNEEILSKIPIIFNLEKKNVPEGLHLIKTPKNFRSYLVVIKVSIKNIEKKVGIVIPGPEKEGFECYNNLQSIQGGEKLEIYNLTYNGFITNIQFVNAYYTYYKNLN
jgi:hypothetical protein